MTATVARVTEISAKSDTSFEDAINVAVGRASQTLRGVTAAGSRSKPLTSRTAGSSRGRSICWSRSCFSSDEPSAPPPRSPVRWGGGAVAGVPATTPFDRKAVCGYRAGARTEPVIP